MATVYLRDFPEDLHRKTKAEAALEGISLKALIIKALEEYLKKKKNQKVDDNMANIIEFPKCELTGEERKQLEEFMENEQKDIQDTSCNSSDELFGEISVLLEYFRKFMDVVEDPDSEINPDYDFSLSLLVCRFQRAGLKRLEGC